MPHKMETPLAGGTANGAKIKAVEASMKSYQISPAPATLSRLRAAHVSRRLGVSDHAAMTIAALHFPEVAS